MLGDLIANLDRPDVARAVLATLDPNVAAQVERRAAAAAMIAPDFVAPRLGAGPFDALVKVYDHRHARR